MKSKNLIVAENPTESHYGIHITANIGAHRVMPMLLKGNQKGKCNHNLPPTRIFCSMAVLEMVGRGAREGTEVDYQLAISRGRNVWFQKWKGQGKTQFSMATEMITPSPPNQY